MARTRMERQAAEYRRVMGPEALARQVDSKRCPACLGVKPSGHKRDCPYWGGREPLPPEHAWCA